MKLRSQVVGTLTALSAALLAAQHVGSPLRIAISARIISGTTVPVISAESMLRDAQAATDFFVDVTAIDATRPNKALTTRVDRCGSKVTCLRQTLDAEQIDLGLLLIANLGVEPPTLTIQLVGSRAPQTGSTDLAELSIDASDITSVVRRTVTTKLLEIGAIQGGRLSVETTPPNAEVYLDGSSDSRSRATSWTLAAGEHTVTISAPDHESVHQSALIVQGQTTRLSVQLAPQSSLIESPWLWGTVVAVAVVGAVVATTLLVSDHGFTICQVRGDATCP